MVPPSVVSKSAQKGATMYVQKVSGPVGGNMSGSEFNRNLPNVIIPLVLTCTRNIYGLINEYMYVSDMDTHAYHDNKKKLTYAD